MDPRPSWDDFFAAVDHQDQALLKPNIERYAKSLIRIARHLDQPILRTVDAQAERLLGAAAVISDDCLNIATHRTSYSNKTVLLIFVVAMTPFSIETIATQVLKMGASKVVTTGVWLKGNLSQDSKIALFLPLERDGSTGGRLTA